MRCGDGGACTDHEEALSRRVGVRAAIAGSPSQSRSNDLSESGLPKVRLRRRRRRRLSAIVDAQMLIGNRTRIAGLVLSAS